MALVKLARRPSRIGFPFSSTNVLPAFDDMDNRFGRLVDRVLHEPFGAMTMPETIGWVPAMDMVETPKEFTLSAELPGLDPKHVDVDVEDGVLTVRGEKTEEKKEEGEDKKVYLYERTFGSFQRSFALPPNVDASKIVAEFDKGVLKIHMPKSAEVKTKGRKVEIKAQ